jgi:hypothetical protein
VTEPMFAVPVQGMDSDERYTPSWVFEHLGLTFDMDPCSPGEGHGDCVPARRKVTRHEDGLATPWVGMVWVNPPFSNATAFADKFVAHGDGVFLGPVANSRWAFNMLVSADLVWLCRDFAFTHPTHAGRRSSFSLMFCSIGDEATSGLRRLAASGVHAGTLMVAS